MRKILLLLILIFSFSLSSSIHSNVFKNSKKVAEAEKFVADLLSKMTLEEKIGQMNQITVEVIGKPRKNGFEKFEIDPDKLKDAILKYKTGSILNNGGFANSIQNWHEIITTIQDFAIKETRLGIPVLYGIDAIHGVNYTTGATLFPQAIAMAATRNRELVRKGAEITALEMKASGIPWTFNPVLGLGREPLWPRMWETFGEDVYMTSEYGRVYIEGIQGTDPSAAVNGAACMKHFLGYSVPVSGNDRTPAWIPERMLREIFLPPFKAAVDAGVLTVMINSSEINGIPVHSDHFILTDLLKNEMGFKGFAVSDWSDVNRLYERDRVAANPKEAVKMAVLAGVDMSMVPTDFSFYEYLLELVKEGEVPESRIDDAVGRILLVKYLLGLFNNAYPDTDLVKSFASNEHTESNKLAAREAITLLKNDSNVLPLSKAKKYLVTGPTSNLLQVLNGGWTITWQGNEEKLYPQSKFTILEAVQAKIGIENVTYAEGCSFENDINTAKAVELAANSDGIILCLGEPTYCEAVGNITDLEISAPQIELAKRLYETGIPVVMVLVEGRPRVINKIVDGASSIITAYLPGMEGGIAIADVLFGDVNPSGKLPFTYPKNVNGFTTYDHKPIEAFDDNSYAPQWAFGHGLSYTTFEYSSLKTDKNEYNSNDDIYIKIDVKNNGTIDGKESVELYICDIVGSVSRPVKQLKGFEKVFLKAGETKTVSFKLSNEDLSFIGRDNKRITEPGEFKAIINNLEKKFVFVAE